MNETKPKLFDTVCTRTFSKGEIIYEFYLTKTKYFFALFTDKATDTNVAKCHNLKFPILKMYYFGKKHLKEGWKNPT